MEADILAAVAIYNSRPQSGRLKGLSPKEMLDRKIKATGFEARRPSEEAFDLIFSRQEIRTVRQGCINIGPRQFHGAYLDAMLPGASVEVLIPLLADRDYVFVRQRKPCSQEPFACNSWQEAEKRSQTGLGGKMRFQCLHRGLGDLPIPLPILRVLLQAKTGRCGIFTQNRTHLLQHCIQSIAGTIEGGKSIDLLAYHSVQSCDHGFDIRVRHSRECCARSAQICVFGSEKSRLTLQFSLKILGLVTQGGFSLARLRRQEHSEALHLRKPSTCKWTIPACEVLSKGVDDIGDRLVV